jgi:hypothetical protein
MEKVIDFTEVSRQRSPHGRLAFLPSQKEVVTLLTQAGDMKRDNQEGLCLKESYVVCLKSSVNGTRKQTKQKIQIN